MLVLLTVVATLLAEPSTFCHYSEACANEGKCDYRPPSRWGGWGCETGSQASCTRSGLCAEFGNCTWRPESPNMCMGGDPSLCAPELSPCRDFGSCRATKGDLFQCLPTPKGCAESLLCKRSGLCRYDAKAQRCAASEKGCRASWECKKRGECKLDREEPRFCAIDPAACATSDDCRYWGRCSSNGGLCTHLSSADCARGENCSIYGQCTQRYLACKSSEELDECARNTCSAMSAADCAGARVCKEFGACTQVPSRGDSSYCAAHPDPAPCQAVAVPVQSVTASSTFPATEAFDLSPDNLIDQRFWTAWAPDPQAPGTARVKLVLAGPTRVVGIRVGNGFQRTGVAEGQLAYAFGVARGIAVHVDNKPYEVGMFVAFDRTLRFAPVETREVELELFDVRPGERYPVPALSLVEVLTCASPTP